MNQQADALLSPTPKGHIPSLDGLRGIAILLVMAVHYVIFEPAPGLENGVKHLTDGGWMGVDLFFVLSGFLITGILADAKGSRTYFRSFYGRRVLRIFPLYYLYLAFIFFLVPLALPSRAAATSSQSEGWFWLYGVNLLVVHTGAWPTVPATARLWSLAIEEQFYLLWPLLVFLLSRKRLLQLAVAVIILTPLIRAGMLLAGLPSVSVFVALWARWDALMTGAFVALALRSAIGQRVIARYRKPVTWAAIAILIGAAVRGRGLSQYAPAMQVIGFTAIALLAGSAVVSTVTAGSRLSRWLSVAWLRAIGRFAYALYLFHAWAMWLLARTGLRSSNPPVILGGHLPAVFGMALIAGALAYGMAWFSWHLFESPILRLKQFLPYEKAVRVPRTDLEAA